MLEFLESSWSVSLGLQEDKMKFLCLEFLDSP
jgi:hypothetical protein